jgi:hypothetical protein
MASWERQHGTQYANSRASNNCQQQACSTLQPSMLCRQPAADKPLLLLPWRRLLLQAMTLLLPLQPPRAVGHLHRLPLTRAHRLLTPLLHRTQQVPLHRKPPPAESSLWADDEGAGATGAADSTSSNRSNHKTATKTESSSWVVEDEGIGAVGAVDSTSSNSHNHQMATTKNFSWEEEEVDSAAVGEVEWDTNNPTKTAMVAPIAGPDADGRWNKIAGRCVTNKSARGGQHGARACRRSRSRTSFAILLGASGRLARAILVGIHRLRRRYCRPSTRLLDSVLP